MVQLAEIQLFESEGNYTRIHFKGERALVARSLNALESKLDPKVFFRANRSRSSIFGGSRAFSPGSVAVFG